MKKFLVLLCMLLTLTGLRAQSTPGAEIIPLSTLDLSLCTNGWGTIHANASIDGNPLTLKGQTYESGVGLHAPAMVVVKLNGAVTRFHTLLGIDDEAKAEGSVDYRVYVVKNSGAEKEIAAGHVARNDAEAVTVEINGFEADDKYLVIDLDEGANDSNDHVDLADAYFEYVEQNSTRPETVAPTVLDLDLFAAQTVFSRPGVRFMHKLRCQNPDAVISVENLPAGLTFNAERSLVEGKIDAEGEYTYDVILTHGETLKRFPVSLTVSSSLQQPVPMMGWLSWNVVQGEISNEVVETVADAMVSQGLLDAGYNYLIIDDLWHASQRDAQGRPVEDPVKFPKGMKAAADYAHSKGLKFGIYSDAGSNTCAGMFGSYGHEQADADQYAAWGIDALKYDYCFAPADAATARARYKAMGDALKASGRDILFYICEWGVREPWKWGSEAGGTTWRATYDTRDCWNGASGGIGVLQSIEGMKDIWPYNGVNRFNDADMMCVAIHGTGKSSSDLCATGPGMTMNEYTTQFALWCMWSSPLTLSFDLRKEISEADLKLITNADLIALDQDPMGQAAETLFHDPATFLVLAKDLENGDVAVSVTNLSTARKDYTFDFAKIPGLEEGATYKVRDCVEQTDLEPATGSLETLRIPRHATRVFRLSRAESDALSRVEATAPADTLYDLQGRRALAATPGIYVRQGKVVKL